MNYDFIFLIPVPYVFKDDSIVAISFENRPVRLMNSLPTV